MANMEAICAALVSGDSQTVISMVKSALDQGVKAQDILNAGLIKGMDLVGERMEEGEMFIPEVLQCAQVMSSALDILRPLLTEGQIAVGGKVVIGTVKGDLHDIGKNLVVLMMRSAGFEVVDLGVDVAPEKFVKTAKDVDANIVALSALLTTTMPMMKKTIDALVESGLRDKVKVMVGGAPVSQSFSNEIGADGYAPDAGSANKLAKALLA
ncbi:MAG: corrinoid protein [Deltaproteobacteria bacterium]|nr:corrinoid protein [Deltaproteobacteria bacterium]